MVSKKTVRLIARFGIIAALVVTAFTIDTLVSVFWLPVKIAACAVIVMMTVCQLFGFGTAVFTTTAFGVVSLIYAFVFPSIATPAFMYPWVSVLPRVCIGVTCYWSFRGLKKLFSGTKSVLTRELLPRSISAVVGVATNTLLVLTMMGITQMLLSGDGGAVLKTIGAIVSINSLVELLCGLLVVPAVSYPVSKQLKNVRI